jgi:hypothetical protein
MGYKIRTCACAYANLKLPNFMDLRRAKLLPVIAVLLTIAALPAGVIQY